MVERLIGTWVDVLTSVADPGSGAFVIVTPGSGNWGIGMGKSSGSELNKPDHISEGLKTIFWVKILKFFDADPDPESGISLNPGSGDGNNLDPG
jgi:hypothetical protein